MRRSVFSAVTGAALFLASVQVAGANVIFSEGNDTQANQENILFKSAQSGITLNGFTNDTDTPVLFTGDGETLVAAASGQARITASDGFFDYLKFEVTGKGFDSLVLNIDANNTSGGVVTFYARDQFNNLYTSADFTLKASGSNFYTITTDALQVMTSLYFQATTDVAFVDAAQFRVVPAAIPTTDTQVPEPASMLLLGSGLAGLAASRRRRQSVR